MGATVSSAQAEKAGLAGTWIINIQNPGIPHAESRKSGVSSVMTSAQLSAAVFLQTFVTVAICRLVGMLARGSPVVSQGAPPQMKASSER
jgi:hypothetical protein